MTTLAQITGILERAAPETPVAFRVGDTVLSGGFHVTELRLAQAQVIDCAGGREDRSEAQMQIMDGFGRPMDARRVLGIAAAAERALPGLSGMTLTVEAELDGAVARHALGAVDMGEGAITLDLVPERAACRPRARGCCG